MVQQLTLFSPSHSSSYQQLNLPNSDIKHYRQFFDETTSNQCLERLKTEINWQQEYIQFYGKRKPIPRITAWYGDEGTSYTYSGIKMNPEPWTELLLKIKKAIESVAKVSFNSVLLNYYRDGNDGVGWHSDDEPELGQNPVIGSLSFGGTRRFSFKSKDKHNPQKQDIELQHGDFLLMQGVTQQYWLHQIPKTKKIVSPRINLTFRVIN